MKPSNSRQHLKSLIKGVNSREKVSKFMDEKKEALLGIMDTSGYQEIRNYRLDVYDNACTEIAHTDTKDVGKVAFYQAQMSNARSFIDRLDNIST